MVWEAFKATCRGWIISYSSAKNREKNTLKKSLMEDLNMLEKRHMREPGNHRLRDAVLLCRAQLQELLHKETAFALFKLKRECFESDDKAGKMLAMRLRPSLHLMCFCVRFKNRLRMMMAMQILD